MTNETTKLTNDTTNMTNDTTNFTNYTKSYTFQNPQWQTVKLSLELLKKSASELCQLTLAGCNGDTKLFIDSHVNLGKDIARATKSIMGYVQNASSK